VRVWNVAKLQAVQVLLSASEKCVDHHHAVVADERTSHRTYGAQPERAEGILFESVESIDERCESASALVGGCVNSLCRLFLKDLCQKFWEGGAIRVGQTSSNAEMTEPRLKRDPTTSNSTHCFAVFSVSSGLPSRAKSTCVKQLLSAPHKRTYQDTRQDKVCENIASTPTL
jgi:hypothetical protein